MVNLSKIETPGGCPKPNSATKFQNLASNQPSSYPTCFSQKSYQLPKFWYIFGSIHICSWCTT